MNIEFKSLQVEEVPLHLFDAREQRKAVLDLISHCGKQKDLFKARKLHSDIAAAHRTLVKDLYVSTALIRMYSRCNSIREAEDTFKSLVIRSVVSWNALICSYVELRLFEEALVCFRKMRFEGFTPDSVTFSCVLNACSRVRCLHIGEEIYDEVCKRGLLEKDVILGNTLVDMYAKCGKQEKAQEVFDRLLKRNVVTWNTLIGGYIRNNLNHKALNYFVQMRGEGICPDSITFAYILKACSGTRSLDIGEKIHEEVHKKGLLHKDLVLGTTLMDMYAKCGMIEKAKEIFYNLPKHDVVSWNVLMDGYAHLGRFDEILKLFVQMQKEGVRPDNVTLACILKACGNTGSLEIGYEIHKKIQKEGLLQKDTSLSTTLLDMYVKCGELGKAKEVFEEIRVRDVVAWSAMIYGYAQHGLVCEAMECFIRMRKEGISPNAVTFTCILKVCGERGSLEIGENIHTEVSEKELFQKEPSLGNALVDMYVKCGMLHKAHEVFNELRVRDIVSWNVLLTAHAHLGHAKSVFLLFNKMLDEEEDIMPDHLSFLVLLSACSHAGLVEEGQILFSGMHTFYCLSPALEHYTCMVDICSRAGCFDKAVIVVEGVVASNRLPLLLSLLSSCRKWGNVELGRWAFEQALLVDGNSAAAYVGMRNIYSAADILAEAENIWSF